MAALEINDFSSPDEVRRPDPTVAVEVVKLAAGEVGRYTFQPGWRWSQHIKPVVGTETCQTDHIGFVLAGVMGVQTADGTTGEVRAGSVYHIPPGHDGWVIGDEPFVAYDVAGVRSFARIQESAERVLGSILFTDIVDSTSIAESVGPARWRELVGSHNERIQLELDRHRGRLVKTTGDGVLALFDGSERAVRAAVAMVRGIAGLGLAIRAGVHTGEVEIVAGDVRGLAVHIAARVMAVAAPGEVLVSGTTHDLAADSGLVFVDAGIHELKGVSGPRQLYRVVTPAPS